MFTVLEPKKGSNEGRQVKLGIRGRWSQSPRHHIVLKCNYATVESKSIKKQQSKAM